MGTSIQGIQYLRAIAALMVVAFHANSFIDPTLDLTVGSHGVDIFFVISGFIISHAHGNDGPHGRGGALGSWSTFAIKRLIRIVPLYWLALGMWLAHITRHGQPVQDAWKDFLFLPHWNAQTPDKVYPAFVPGWTINAEMFFYGLFSLTLFKPALRGAMLGGLSLLVLAGLVMNLDSAPARFYTSSTMAGFILGCLLQRGFVEYTRRAGKLPPAMLGWLIMPLGFAGLQWFRGAHGSVLPPLFGAFTVAGALLAWVGTRSPLWHKLGDASYAIYLSHLFSFAISQRLINLLPAAHLPPIAATLARLAVCLLTAAALGWLIHKWLEQPLLNALRARLLPTVPAKPIHRPTVATAGGSFEESSSFNQAA